MVELTEGAVVNCSRHQADGHEDKLFSLPWLGVRIDMPNEVGGGIVRGTDEVRCTIRIPEWNRHEINLTPWSVAILAAVYNYNLLNEPKPVTPLPVLSPKAVMLRVVLELKQAAHL